MLKKYLQPKILLPLILIVFPFLVYWYTKPPSILWVDSGTMIAASYTLGIPNPPGFPFYMMASHLFSIMPLFNILTRLELFTIVFSVLAVFLVYRIILLILQNDFFFYRASNTYPIKKAGSRIMYFSAFFGAFALAFSYQYWSQSENTEAFIFTDFFLILFIYLLLFLEKKRKELIYEGNTQIKKFSQVFFKLFLLLAFLYGLASGTNPTVFALVPAVLYVMYLNRRILNIQRLIILGLVGLVTVAAVYSYLPLRASAWPFVNWGNPQTLSLFIGQLRGAGLNIYEPSSGSINGFTGSPVVFLQSVSHFIYLFLLQFTPLLLPFVFFGGFFLFKKNRRLFIFLLSVVLVDVFYAGLYYSGNQESWFILSWIIFAILIGIGFYFSVLKFTLGKRRTYFLFLLAFLPLLAWFIPLNRSGHFYTSDYATNLYSSLKKNAILIETGDFTNSLGYYLREADKFRPDVVPVTANTFYVNKWYRDDLRHAAKNIVVSDNLEKIIQYRAYDEYNLAMNEFIADNIGKHPIYVTPLTLRASALAGTSGGQLVLDPRFKFVPHGLSLEVVKKDQKTLIDPNSFNFVFRNFSFPDKAPFYLERNYNTGFNNIKNDYAYGFEALGDYLLNSGQYADAFYYYEKANSFSPNNPEILSRYGQYYGILKEYYVSEQYLTQALELQPDNLTIRFNLALSLAKLGNIRDAKQQLDIIIQAGAGQQISEEAKNQEKQLLNNQASDLLLYTDKNKNFSFIYPKDWKISRGKAGEVLLSNSKTGQDALNITFFGGQALNGQSIEDFINSSPLKPEGILLDTKRYDLPGFTSYDQIYSQGSNSLQLFVLSKGSYIWLISVFPGDSSSLNDLYSILRTFKALE